MTDWKELATRAREALRITCDAAKYSECEAAQGELDCADARWAMELGKR